MLPSLTHRERANVIEPPAGGPRERERSMMPLSLAAFSQVSGASFADQQGQHFCAEQALVI
jgi:hypothetical protein